MKNTKSKIIIMMCAVLCIMAVGYAAFSTALTITGTANIASEWKVVFTNITQVSKTSGVNIKSSPVASGTTATFNVGLTSPGDKIVYKITLANQGTIDAVIKNIGASATDSPAIIFTVEGVNTGDVINNKTSKDFTVTIEYDPHVTSQPDKLQKTLTVSIVTEQYVNQSIDSSTPNVTQPLYLRSEILKNNVAYADTNIDFSQTSEATGTNGLYVTSTNTEGNLPTYYFRGAVDNNYVKFGTHEKNTCTYNGDAVYVVGNAIVYAQTREVCLSTNICDARLLGIGYIVGVDQETCQEAVETQMGISSSMMSCQYNKKSLIVIDMETEEPVVMTETECLSGNVCYLEVDDAGLGGLLIGYKGLDEATCLSEGGQWTNSQGLSYNATYPYIEEKATYGNETTDIMWRIVRINEDGSIRIVTQETLGTSVFNEIYGDSAYVGYMYGTSGSGTYALTHANTNDSTIKDYLDDWYVNDTNLSSYVNSHLADSGFCNDRSVAPSAGLWASDDTALGYASNKTYYGAYNRLYTNKSPQFACPNASNDLFTTTSSSKGNKALTNPIGLLTADEVAYAGGVYNTSNTSMYLTNNSSYWTMSPFTFYDPYAYAWYVNHSVVSNYNVNSYYVADGNLIGVRPVVNLQSRVEIISGDGTSGNPYIIK